MDTTNNQQNTQTTGGQTGMVPHQEQESGFLDLQSIVRIFIGKWYYFLISVIVCVSLGVIQIWRTPRVYVQEASVLVKDQKGNNGGAAMSAAFADIAGMNGFMTNSVVNEMHIMQSRSVMGGVVALHGFQYHYYEPRFWRLEELYKSSPVRLVPENYVDAYNRETKFEVQFMENDTTQFTYKSKDTTFVCPFNQLVEFPHFGYATMEIDGEAALRYYDKVNHSVKVVVATVDDVITAYLKNLDCAMPDKKNEGSTLTLSYSSTSVQKAADVLQALIDEYNRQTINSKTEMLDSSLAFIGRRIDAVSVELRQLDDRLEQFKRSEKTVRPDAEAAGFLTRSTGQEEKIAELIIQERLTRDLIQDLNKKSGDFPMIPYNVGIENTVLNGQIKSYNEDLLKYRQLKSGSSDKNPTVVRMAAALQDMFDVIVTTANDVHRQLEMQLRETQSLATKNLSRVADANSNVKAVTSIERDQVVKSELYNYLLQKTEENAIMKSMTEPNIRIIDLPWGSDIPISPKKARILLIAFIIGLCLPYVIFIGKDYIFTSVRGRSDVTAVIKAPIVGEIPSKPHNLAKQTFFVEAGADNQISEAFRILRTNLSFLSNSGNPVKVIAMTSTQPGEGKSFVSANLAMVFAISGKKVCLVESDLRKMQTSRSFKLRGKKGMSEFLATGEGNVVDLVQPTSYENVFILPGGVIPPNPAELLMSENFDKAIAQLREAFDVVILDNPPLDIVADTGIANRVADATLYVIRAGVVDRRQLPIIQDVYASGRLRNMAIVINDINYDALSYSVGYSGYGKHYGYRYYGHTYYNQYASYEEGGAKHRHLYGSSRKKK